MPDASANMIAHKASLLADPARAAMLLMLMDGRAYSAGELAKGANITAQTASGHFAKLLDAGFLTLLAQGRHRYYALKGAEIAALIESMGALVEQKQRPVTGPKDKAMRLARRCYDHLAGELGVRLARSCEKKGFIAQNDGHFTVTEKGHTFFCDFGLEPDGPLTCKACLDWSERRYHIGGALGRNLLSLMIDKGWMRNGLTPRALVLTPKGQNEARTLFDADSF